jgi:long-chain acyl-CoA synthetase
MADAIYQAFADVARRHAARPALMNKVGDRYVPVNYADLSRIVDEVAAGLAARGVKPGDRVGIYSYNRPEWVVTDLAVAKLGAVLIPVYHTLTDDAVRYILNDANVRHLVVETPDLFAVVARVLDQVPDLRDIITLFERDKQSHTGKTLFSFELLRAEGAKALAADPKLGEAHLPGPDDLFTVCYTSGTTGEPKGAMLTHRNILSNVVSGASRFNINETDVVVSFLPLCHMFERTCGYYTVLLVGGCIAYAESTQTVARDVQAVRPTILVVVPRVLEKVYNVVRERVLTGPAYKRWLMVESMRVFSRQHGLKLRGRPVPLGLRLERWVLYQLVVKKLHALSGGRLRYLVSGGAPLDKRLGRILRSFGFNIYEGYGLTETSPVVCSMMPGDERIGTVGKPMEDVEIRIGPQSEVLVRGPNVMKGYLNKPDETADVIDAEGWFHTGDQGKFDERGNLVITGRIKEIIVNSYGKNIAPVPIEQQLAESDFVEQAMVYGDRKPFLVALVVPSRIVLEDWCTSRGIDCSDYTSCLANPRVVELYRDLVEKALKDFAQYEQVKAFRLVPEPFTVENNLLTPSFKLRRPQVYDAYKDAVEKLYEGH